MRTGFAGPGRDSTLTDGAARRRAWAVGSYDEGRFTGLRYSGIWRQLVLDHVAMLRAELAVTELSKRAVDAGIRSDIEASLCQAEEAANTPSRAISWWRGTLIDRAWFSLHTAEVLITRHEPALRAAERWQMVTGARPRCEVPWGSCRHEVPDDASPAIARSIQHQHAESDRRYTQTRTLRNRLLLFTALGWVTVALLGAFLTSGVLGGELWGWSRFGLIALFGAIGAYIVHLPSVITAGAAYSPYSLAGQQLLVKLVAGPLFAVIGIMLVQSELLDQMRPFETFGVNVLVFAAIFGGSQQVLTGFIDRRANRVLEGDDDGGTCCTRAVTMMR
jgi:hypothetical protein